VNKKSKKELKKGVGASKVE